MHNLKNSVLDFFDALEGQSFQNLIDKSGLIPRISKSSANNFLLRYMESQDSSLFARLRMGGIRVKTIGVSIETKRCFESSSLKKIEFRELLDFDFWNSDLFRELDSIIFLPILKRNPKDQLSFWRVGKPSILSLDKNLLIEMSNDYVNYQDFTRELIHNFENHGKDSMKDFWNTKFPRGSTTSVLHMRPHARARTDFDLSLVNYEITKHSFWLNIKFLNSYLIN